VTSWGLSFAQFTWLYLREQRLHTQHDDELDDVDLCSEEIVDDSELRTDWARLEAMSGEEALRNALNDPDSLPLTPELASRLRRVPNPRAIRQAMGLTQDEFARRFEIAVSTLRAWEEHRIIPDSTAKAYLRVIERNPDAVVEALNNRSLVPTRATE
jgi:putative transcriptional regulator